MKEYLAVPNHAGASLREIPLHPFPLFREILLRDGRDPRQQIAAFFPVPVKEGFRLFAVLSDGNSRMLHLFSTVIRNSYPSLTPALPALCWFERELWEQYQILPEGHPRLKPLRFQNTLNGTDNHRPEPGDTDYFTMEGEAVHEVAVGPVHAGVIEPGHFRFQCMGENVYSLEIELGYQHRGIEKLLEQGPDPKTKFFIETASGDSSVAESLCYHRILEFMTGRTVPPRGEALRQLALELERIANHIGDLGALSGDAAYLPTASYCGRIRGDFLNMTAALCGNRFGRNFVLSGGVRYDLPPEEAARLLQKVETGEKELNNALDLLFDEPSVLDRFENTGTVSRETAEQLGLTGMAARASGLERDVRTELDDPRFPEKISRCAVEKSGDVLARALIRKQELAVSLDMVKKLLRSLPEGAFVSGNSGTEPLPPDTLTVSLTEAWRGMLCHAALTGPDGKFLRYKIVDPSFHNWPGLEMALRDQQISDFPLCNKSFNLSYCGHDL